MSAPNAAHGTTGASFYPRKKAPTAATCSLPSPSPGSHTNQPPNGGGDAHIRWRLEGDTLPEPLIQSESDRGGASPFQSMLTVYSTLLQNMHTFIGKTSIILS